MAAGARETVTFRDAKGNTARTSYYVSSTISLTAQNTAANAILTPLIALTNAALAAATGPSTNPALPVTYGTNAAYPSVEDKAIFTFTSAVGSIHRVQVPSPIAAIFLADGETIDPSNTLVTAFVSAYVANAVSRDGVAITFGAFGTRIRRKMHRRFSIFTKNPSLSGPGE